MEMLAADLHKVGIQADSVFSLAMPNTYVCLPFMNTDRPDVERKKIADAGSAIVEIAQAIKERHNGVCSTVKGPVPYLLSNVIGRYFNSRMITDRPFRVDSSACIRCGRCAAACPTGNISGGAGNLPVWHDDGHCTCCMACYHHCPAHAISYGRSTRHKGQYYFGRKNNNGNA